MAGNIGKNSLRGIAHEEFHYPLLVSGTVSAASVGSAVMVDTAAANTVKLATDGASILGRLETFEDRTIEGTKNGAISLFGGMRFTVDPNATSSSPDETPAVGDFLVGAVSNASVAGYVRKASAVELATGTKKLWQVMEVENSGATVVAIAI